MSTRPSLVLDFLFILLPCVLSVMWTEYNWVKLALMLFPVAIKHSSLVLPWNNPRAPSELDHGVEKLHYITEYRSMMLLATAVSILAVDFPAYPRRFVKSETFGISLMDLGTGSVIFASALVARQVRHKPEDLGRRFRSAVLGCLPLLVLGVLRFSVHKAVNYQEHVSEYGVHWNFFLSLCTVVIVSSLVQLPPLGSGLLAVTLMVWYQSRLNGGLEEFILNASRTDFISQNREGIFGCFGFLAIYQLGLALRPWLTDSRNCLRNSALLWSGLCVLTWTIAEKPSRRLNNSSYVLCTVTHNCFCLFLFCLSERVRVNYSSSILVKAINYNQLPYFMFSNLLTGAVNLLMRTLYMSDVSALGVVLMYQVVAAGVICLLHHLHIRLKYW